MRSVHLGLGAIAVLVAAYSLVGGRAAATSCGAQPAPVPCNTWVCTIDGWTEHVLANGTACSDGDACTYGDACYNGACVGTRIACGPCEYCNGTATCQKITAGTQCPVASNPPNPCEAVCDGVSAYCQPR
jgi:hypothetical protein